MTDGYSFLSIRMATAGHRAQSARFSHPLCNSRGRGLCTAPGRRAIRHREWNVRPLVVSEAAHSGGIMSRTELAVVLALAAAWGGGTASAEPLTLTGGFVVLYDEGSYFRFEAPG